MEKNKVKVTVFIIICVVFGYVIYNQFFYAPTPPIDVPGHPIADPDETDDEPNDEPFDGIIVDWMPFVDDSDRIALYLFEDEILSIKTVDYQWESKSYSVYEKAFFDLDEQLEITQHIVDKTNVIISNLRCENVDQDGLLLVACQFDEGYLEVLQDGSYYVIFHDIGVIPIVSYEKEDMLDAIMNSWINELIELESWDLVLNDLHYDTFGEPIYDYIIVESLNVDEYQTIYSINISTVDQSIVGLSKNSDVVNIIETYEVLTIQEIQSYLELGLFESSMVLKNEITEIEILGYGVTYDSEMFMNVVVPVIHVYVTSEKENFANCFDVEGIVIHPIKVIAFDKTKIRAR
jgi:hypothetical protein